MKKWILIVFCLMIVSYFGYQYVNKGSNSQTAAQIVPTATVQKGKFEVKVSGSGSVQPVSSTDVKAAANKQVYEVLAKTGDEVKSGQNLITFSDGSAAITAPHDGIVTSLPLSPNERVNAGQVVAHVTNYKDLQTVLQIDELDIPKIKLGQVVSIKANSFPDENFTGKVTAISNEGTVSNGVTLKYFLVVEDNGIGINEDQIPRIFDRFYQSDKARTISEGTGLGLSIAQWIINKHHGKVLVSSHVDKGTKIEISFPKNQSKLI